MTDLADVPIFASLSEDELKQISNSLNYKEIPAGKVLMQEGQEGDSFLIIKEGMLEVVKDLGTKNEKLLNQIGPTECVGEMSLLSSEGLRNASVRVIEDAALWEMTRADFELLMLNNPRAAYEVLRQLSQRLNRSQAEIIKDLQQKNLELTAAYEDLKAAQAQIIEKERLERELQVAHEIQMSLLPSKLPDFEGFEFGAILEPARQVGGDLYDFIPLSEGRLGIVIGDVTDKGVPAAIFMARVQALLRAEAIKSISPDEVLRKVNELLLNHNQQGYFVTMIYGILQPGSGIFEYARAGHELPILCSGTGDAGLLPLSPGQPLGILYDPIIDCHSIEIPPGQTLVLYTDGVTDQYNDLNIPFGEDKLLISSCGINDISTQEICDHLLQTVIEYRNGKPLQDDVTIVVIKRRII